MKHALVLAATFSLAAQDGDLFDRYRRIAIDFGGLTRYGSENTEIRTPPSVVFFGDDITENWKPFFPGKPYLNRGIAGQTTAQMLVRFRQDVIALNPKLVVIQGGANDFLGHTGPATQGTISENIMSMVELAKFHGIGVVLASVTPVCDCPKRWTTVLTPGRLLGLNEWLRDYAKKSGAVYLDLYSQLADGRRMKAEWTVDGLVPNADGYARLRAAAEQAIAPALPPRP
jgi:lysophospholipase L1-like esterase